MAGFSFDPNRVAHAEAAGWHAYWVDLEKKLRQCYRSIQEEMATGAESVELRAASNV